MKVGIVVPHWFERGISYIALNVRSALVREGHDVLVLARPSRHKPVGSEFDVPGVTISKGDASRWAEQNELDVAVACSCAPELPCPSMLYLEPEYMSPEMVDRANDRYDAVIAALPCIEERYDDLGVDDVELVTWGTDLDVFQPVRDKHGSVTFFQPANFGGQFGRKRVRQTRRIFASGDIDGELVIHLQRGSGVDRDGPITTYHGTVSRGEMAARYAAADVALLPSAWEGLGLTFLEALASGLAIVTVDAPPMNEYVEQDVNGILLDARLGPTPDIIHVSKAVVSSTAYRRAIERMAADSQRTREMGRRSREVAEERFDWSENGRRLVRAIEEVASES